MGGAGDEPECSPLFFYSTIYKCVKDFTPSEAKERQRVRKKWVGGPGVSNGRR